MEIFVSQGAPPVSVTPAVKLATCIAGVIDNSGKFAPGVNNISVGIKLRKCATLGYPRESARKKPEMSSGIGLKSTKNMLSGLLG